MNRKILILCLSCSVILVLGINAFFLFIFEKAPATEKLEIEIETETEIPITEPVTQDLYDPAHNTLPSIFIREIPLALETEIDNHLTAFRKKASGLQVGWPDAFFISVPTNKKIAALTFDDGPDSTTTGKVLDILRYYQIPATFFFIGQQLDKYNSVVNAAYMDGHLVANHSWTHPRPLDISTLALFQEIEKTQEKLMRTKDDLLFFRPPYGLITHKQMDYLYQHNYKVISWSVDSMDWYFETSPEIVKCVLDAVHPGAIILMHSAGGKDNRQAALKALPQIIERMQNDGYEFVTIKTLLEHWE